MPEQSVDQSDENPNPGRLQTPEELHDLRRTVEDWLKRARAAVGSFKTSTGSFMRDSGTFDRSSLTTTARCYMALANAERQLEGSSDWNTLDLRDSFCGYAKEIPVTYQENEFKVSNSNLDDHDKPLNIFEVAHLADFEFVRSFFARFEKDGDSDPILNWTTSDGDTKVDIIAKLSSKLKRLLAFDGSSSTQLEFYAASRSSEHFFVTLHALRAKQILAKPGERIPKIPTRVADEARRFCMEQCFYWQRQIQHRQDPARLVFACTIYCMYEREVDREIIAAIIDAIAGMQETSGKWPASYPIIGQEPQKKKEEQEKEQKKERIWYIASAELALCLTWLYFQPNLPDASRFVVLAMLERHFRNWIIPTFRTVDGGDGENEAEASDGEKNAGADNECRSAKSFSGWVDDSSIGQDSKVVGWTTAIVCHFLANYHAVLNDYINRRVVESLGLQDVAERYLIDGTKPNRNERWKQGGDSQVHGCWPDLPPVAWAKTRQPDELAGEISGTWTDPTPKAGLSRRLAQHVLSPVLEHPAQLPRERVAGIFDGTPGTRKTTLVKQLSTILNWPYVPVPASTIFGYGFDNMEARASEVFRRLNYLTQCVIFFDEFEEFFRDRMEEDELARDNATTSKVAGEDVSSSGPENREETDPAKCGTSPSTRFSPHDRTIAAFTTSAMLPRLQDLHNAKRSLIFLATNYFERLDRAIVRSGRFDFRETIEHPTIGRFNNGKGSFFSNPTDKTLLMLQCKRDSEELRRIGEIVYEALSSEEAKVALAARPGQSNGEANDHHDNHPVPFRVVESVAKEVAARIRAVPTTLDDKDNDIILDEAKRVLKRELELEGKHPKGPGPLPGVRPE